MASGQYLAEKVAPVNLNVPASSNTVKVSCIDSTSRITLPAQAILTPHIGNHQNVHCPAFSYLIENERNGQKVLFDLGIRKDWKNMSPAATKRVVDRAWGVTVDKHVSEILTENDVPLDSINAIVWSHHHWDHQGAPSLFPKSTDLVVGPGFKKMYTPGWPTNPEGMLKEEDWEGRNFREVDVEKEGKGLKVGRFWAYDYFGDGSFYLLDTPGHTVGHLCALARTTSSPDTFIFFGGDACHHGAEFRPTQWLPLPKELSTHQLKGLTFPCPGSLFLDVHPEKKGDKPFYEPAKGFSYDHDVACWTIEGVEEYDGNDNVLIAIAHDGTFLGQLDMFPKTMNDWKERGEKDKVLWRFLDDFEIKTS